ncbi:MAG TPA: hypothetical protein V6C72_19250, partial [Chroococcales cyanobacterium]
GLMIKRLSAESPTIQSTDALPAAKLIALGQLFVEWSTVSPSKFQEMIRGLVVESYAKHLGCIDWLLRAHQEKPDFWASDLKLYRSWIRKGIVDAELDVTDDLMDAFGAARGRAMFQTSVFRFGQLLTIWPEIYKAAAVLHVDGVRVGNRV